MTFVDVNDIFFKLLFNRLLNRHGRVSFPSTRANYSDDCLVSSQLYFGYPTGFFFVIQKVFFQHQKKLFDGRFDSSASTISCVFQQVTKEESSLMFASFLINNSFNIHNHLMIQSITT